MKNKLRDELILQHQNATPAIIKAKSALIIQKLNNFIESIEYNSLGVYHPLKGEVSLEYLSQRAAAYLCYPAMNGEVPCFVSTPTIVSTLSSGGVIAYPDVIIVPMLGFNRRKYRLGRGGGFYDRLLAQNNALTIGLAFADDERQFEPEPHDIPLNHIITEQEIIS